MADTILTDEEIQAKVLDELRWNPEVEPTDVGIEVDNGVVTLTGTIDSYPMKFAAEKAAHRVLGVKAVANDIEVQLPFDKTRTDTDVAAAAASALEWDETVPHERIWVTVREGWVTLEGKVDRGYQKDATEKAICNLTGVRGVTNLITITAPKVSPEQIRAKIEEALTRSAELDARRIHVEAQDSQVVLSGVVRTWVAREEAENAAWAAEGVSDVVNQIAVSA